jgi:hypothetical protein
MAKKKLLGALPVGFKGKFAGVPFSISVQYDIYGNVSAIVLSTENKAIIAIDGDSKKIKALADKFFTYISTNTDQKLKTDLDFKYFQKEYYSKIKDFVKNITEEVNDYNKKQMPIKKAVKKVAKKVATKTAVIKKAIKKVAPKKAIKKSASKKAVKKITIKPAVVLRKVLPAVKKKQASSKIYYESGIGSIKQNVLSDYKNTLQEIAKFEKFLIDLKEVAKNPKFFNIKDIKKSIVTATKLIKEKKTHLRELKKLI